MVEAKSIQQVIQDEEFALPYHYIPQYGNYTQSYSWSWSLNYICTVEFILQKLEDLTFDSHCDVGTGDGRLVREIAKKFGNEKTSGIDYSERAINLARALNPSLKFQILDIIEDDTLQKFDVLTLMEVFEHIPLNLCQKFVQGLFNLLHEDGLLLLTVPHQNKALQDKHYQHFTSDSLITYFEDYFNVQEVVFFEDLNGFEPRIKFLLENPYFILNHQGLKNYFYRLYKKYCFYSTEKNSGRIFLKLKKNGK